MAEGTSDWSDPERAMVRAAACGDERRENGTSGSGRSALSGRPALMLLLGLAGPTIATAAVRTWGAVPPWVELFGLAVTGTVAIAGMMCLTAGATRARGPSAGRDAAPPDLLADEPLPLPSQEADAARTRFQVDTARGRVVIAAIEVQWIEASGNYARLHLSNRSFLYRIPLAQLERELNPEQFLRVHRSAIVNVDAVQRIEPLPSGDARIQLGSGTEVRLSRRYSKTFHERTGRT